MKAEKTGWYNVKTSTFQNVQHLTDGQEVGAEIEFIGEELPAPSIDPPNWVGLKRALFYSSLFQRAVVEYETINQTIFSALTTTLSDGVNGNAKEQTVLSLLGKLNMVFSESEKNELNGYFQANNFTIRL